MALLAWGYLYDSYIGLWKLVYEVSQNSKTNNSQCLILNSFVLVSFQFNLVCGGERLEFCYRVIYLQLTPQLQKSLYSQARRYLCSSATGL